MTASAGQSVGTWALLDTQPRLMRAKALEEVRLLKIRSEDFYDLLSDHEEITPVMFRAVVERVKTLVAD
jgi:CRP-like cAMP-binding protein